MFILKVTFVLLWVAPLWSSLHFFSKLFERHFENKLELFYQIFSVLFFFKLRKNVAKIVRGRPRGDGNLYRYDLLNIFHHEVMRIIFFNFNIIGS